MTPNASLGAQIFNRKMGVCLLIGFSSGLPLYILITLMPAWLRDEGVDLASIGLFTLIGLPYTWKFIWAPLLDRYPLTRMGRRRSWLLLSQVLLLGSIATAGLFSPTKDLQSIVFLAGAVAVFSATQDIAIDAFRREYLTDNELGLGNSLHVNAYRISGLIPGSLSLILADHYDWGTVYLITAAFMSVGIVTTLIVKEPESSQHSPKTLREAVVEPLHEFFTRKTVLWALGLLGFMFLYKLGDNMATALATPFYLDMGFTKTEIGIVAKNAALWPSIIGGLIGGIVMLKIGINKCLWLFGGIQWITILGFVWLSQAPETSLILGISVDKIAVLAIVLSMEYLGVGLGTAAFVAFIARATDIRYTASQLALFTALASLPRTLASASSGFIVESIGWTDFFWFCALLAAPGMLLLLWVAPWHEKEKAA